MLKRQHIVQNRLALHISGKSTRLNMVAARVNEGEAPENRLYAHKMPVIRMNLGHFSDLVISYVPASEKPPGVVDRSEPGAIQKQRLYELPPCRHRISFVMDPDLPYNQAANLPGSVFRFTGYLIF
jgi:hypothetical protein